MIGGAKFTSGRVGIVLLLIPAIVRLTRAGRQLLSVDFVALLTGVWMIGAAIYVDGTASLSSAGAEALEFVGGYFVARAFVYGPEGLAVFIRVLKLCLLITVGVAVLDNLTGRWVVPDLLASLLNIPSLSPQYRSGAIRAISTFSHPILMGTFCAIVGVVVLFTETNIARRWFYIFVCLVGCVLSFSSAALMSFALATSVYVYDWQLCNYRWRWKALIAALFALWCVVMVSTNNPLGWVLSHLTLDPQSSYFRLLIWDAALERISQAPMTGYALGSVNNAMLDATTDSVWLVYTLRYGIPMAILMVLVNVLAMRSTASVAVRSYMAPLQLAFTTVLVMFMFVGLTVAFWNYMWIFWGVCIGARASVYEWNLAYGLDRRTIADGLVRVAHGVA